MDEFIQKRKAALEARRRAAAAPPVTTWYLDAYVAHADRSPIYREAMAWKALLENADTPLYPEETITGNLVHSEAAMFYYGSATYVAWDHVERYIRENSLSPEAEAGLRQRADTVERCRYKGVVPAVFPPEEMASVEAHAASTTMFGGHMILDYDTILAIGLGGYAEKIRSSRREDRAEFYDAMDAMLEGVRAFIRRYADKAAASRAEDIAADLRRVAGEPPATFRQAVQLVWLLHVLNGSDSFGRFDQYMRPFYERDIREGVIDREEARRLLADLIVKIEEVNQIQNMTIGGVTPDGRPAYSDLTVDLLDAARLVGYKGPNLALRVTADMPRAVWDAALACIGSGIGIPALYGDAAYAASLAGQGIPREEANNFALAGCSQIMVPGKCNFYNDVGILNAAKILELTMNDGFDPRTGAQVGPHTGKPQEFTDFDAFLAAFYTQTDYFCALEGRINNREAAYRAACEGYAMRTLFTGDCIEKGLPVFEGGARYNNIELEIIGLTNAADGLHAVRQVVFEEGAVSLGELAGALLADFEGAEGLRRRLLACDKFGNDREEVDRLRAAVTDRFYRSLNAIPAAFGGVMVPGEVIFTSHDYEGAATGATPDGRRAYTVLADSAGASQGMDQNGPTALLNSVLKIPTEGRLLTSVVTNLKFTSSLYHGSVEKIRWLAEGFFAGGGMQLQINVVDARALEEAARHPEAYRSLIVRVGGYSDYFVNLAPALQREIIARTLQEV